MKSKQLFAIAVLLWVLMILLSFRKEQKYNLSLTKPEIEMLWNVVDQSNAPHAQVKYVQELIGKQYSEQDSTIKKK